MRLLYYKLKLVNIFCPLLLLYGCFNSRQESKIHLAKVIENNEKIVVENNDNRDVFFSMNVNGKLFSSFQDIVQHIEKMPDEFPGEPAVRKAWRLVTLHTFHMKTGIDDPWLHNPLLVLNSTGFGLCDDLAEVLSAVWSAQGYRSRVWTLEGHVVPEVYAEEKWQMFDPSFAVYYLNKDGKVAGVEELAIQPELIYNPLHRLPPDYNTSFIQDARKYSKDVAFLYKSAENNKSSENKTTENLVNNYIIHQLPAGATMEFPVMTPDPIAIKETFRKWRLKSFIKYTLPDNWNGTLRLPFVVCMIKGKGVAVINNRYYQLGNDTLHQLLKKLEDYYPSIELKNTSGITEVYCLFNHAVFNTAGSDTVILTGRQLKYVTMRSEPNRGYKSEPFINFSNEKKVSESAWKYYNFYLEKKDSLSLLFFTQSSSQIDSAIIGQSIHQYFLSMNILQSEERIKKAEQLTKKWAIAYPTLKSFQFKKHFSFHDDPAYFFYMLAVLEHSSDNFYFQ